jgi:hypothetical protein
MKRIKFEPGEWVMLAEIAVIGIAAVVIMRRGNTPTGPRSGVNKFSRQLAASAPRPGGGVLPSIQQGTLSQGQMLWRR